MSTVRGSIDVAVSAGVAYEELCHLENYPHFMAAVTDVTPLSPTTAHMVMEVGDSRTEFDACIVEERPGEVVSWESLDGPHVCETVRLEPLSAGTTRVIAELVVDATQFMPSEAHAQDVLNRRLKADLTGFKRYIEATSHQQSGLATREAGSTEVGGSHLRPTPSAMPTRRQGALGPIGNDAPAPGLSAGRPGFGSNERPVRSAPAGGNLGPMQRPFARPPARGAGAQLPRRPRG